MIAHAVLASTAYDIGRAVGYVIVPVIIGAIILFIARSQNRSTTPGAATVRAAAAPAGWYDDPWRQARLRYWDGTAWTGHTAE
jgi:hypothetical protein